MAKIFSGGALIPYGDVLPTSSQASDGALFFRTNAGVLSGLWLFGFIKDANSGAFGPQVSQNWTQISFDASNLVLKTGDVMTGALEVPSFLRITQTSSAQRLLIGNQDSGGVNRPGIVEGVNGTVRLGSGNSWAGFGGSMSTFLSVDASIDTGLVFRGNQVWHAANDGAGSNLDADLLDGQQGAFYRDVGNMNAGILPIVRGGTGNNAVVTGGVVYGAVSSMAYSASGTASQVLLSGGTGSPVWTNQSALSVGNATNATFATTAGSATNATNATNASNVPWTGITGLPSAQQTFANTPTTGYSTRASASLFYDMGNAGIASMNPSQFIPGTISGFDAYTTSDMGSFQVGMTIVGLGGSGARSMQLTANWNFEEAAPNGLRWRVNDDTSNTAAWGAFRTIWDQGNLTNLSQLTNDSGYITSAAVASTYVAKAGDTMTGGLFVPSIAVGAVSMPGTGGINTSGNITASGFVSSLSNITSNGGNLITNTGYVSAGNNAGSTGYIRMQTSGSGSSGYLEFWPGNNIRAGYIGNTSATGSTDTGTINYVCATHAFTGNLTTTGNITAQGDVTAFSDARLKTNIKTIHRAVERVMTLSGVTFDRIRDGSRSTGLIAQEVQAVLPEAVIENEDGMLSVAYGNLAGLFVQTIKEQQTQIEELKAQVESLIRMIG